MAAKDIVSHIGREKAPPIGDGEPLRHPREEHPQREWRHSPAKNTMEGTLPHPLWSSESRAALSSDRRWQSPPTM